MGLRRAHTYRLYRQTKTKLLNVSTSLVLVATSLGGIMPALFTRGAAALSTVTVSNASTSGWSTADTRPGGAVAFVPDATTLTGTGALRLTTDATNAAKAQLLTGTQTKLADVSAMSYYTKQVSTSSPSGDPSYQVLVDLDNNGSIDTNLVYEPYWNGTPVAGTWQNWDVLAGKFWSSKTAGGLTSGAGGPPLYTISDVLALNPDAAVLGFGVNVGSYNPSYNVEADALNFNGTLYDFEAAPPATPTNLRFENPSTACGGYTNVDHTTSAWDAVAGAVSYNYHVDGPNGLTYDASLANPSNTGSFGSGDQGTYTFKVQAVDANGLTSAWSNTCSITYDTTTPTTPTLLAPPDNGYETTNDFYFTWTASDDTSPVTYEFQSDNDGSFNSPWDSIANGNSEQNNLTEPKIHSTGAPDGTYYWRVRAIDAAGNKSAWMGSRKMTIDSHAPTALLTSPSSNQVLSTRTTNGKLNLTGTASDSDFNYYYCYVTNAQGEVGTRSPQCVTAWAAGTPFQSAFAASSTGTTNGPLGYVDLSGLPDGNYTAHLVVKDKAGNTTEATQPFVLDNTAPAVPTVLSWKTSGNAVVPNGGSTNDANGTASWQDSSSDVDHYIYKYWNDIPGNQYKPGNEYTTIVSGTSLPGVFNQGEGTHHYCVEAVDALGNTSACSEAFTVTYDATKPTGLTNTSPSNNAVLGTHDFTFDWSDASDASTVAYNWEASLSNATNADGSFTSPLASHASLTTSEVGSPGTPDGTYYWHVQAVDAAGNTTGWTDTWKVTVDTTAPTVSVNSLSTTDTTPTLTGTVNDSNATVTVTVNGHTYNAAVSGTTWTANVTDALPVGTYDVSASAKDAAGNVGHDTTTNELTITAPASQTQNTNNVNITNTNNQVATTGNATNTGNTNGGNAQTGDATNDNGTVLGATTNNPQSTDKGQVKSDSTTVNLKNAGDTKNGKFLALGWWWLAIIAVVLGFWFLVAGRRRNDEN